jgi:hypothetical protein
MTAGRMVTVDLGLTGRAERSGLARHLERAASAAAPDLAGILTGQRDPNGLIPNPGI